MPPEPIILLDEPDDGLCDAHGWVSTDASEEDARGLLEQFCMDEDGSTPARPVGPAKRVWLEPDAGGMNWDSDITDDSRAVEFWQFDATETAPVSTNLKGDQDA
jgi:hypothetical protein